MSATKVALASLASFVRVCAGSALSLRKQDHINPGVRAHLQNIESMLMEIAQSLHSLAAVSTTSLHVPSGASNAQISHIAENEQANAHRRVIEESSPFLTEDEEVELGKRMEEILGVGSE